MRTAPVLLRLAVCLSSLAPLASAWPGWLPEIDSLIVRQDDGDDTPSSAAETGAAATDDEAEPTKTNGGGGLNTAEPTGEPDASETESESARRTGTASDDDDEDDDDDDDDDDKKSTKTKSVSIPPNAAVGGVSITEPVTSIEPTVLYKIGDNVTFGWNYTGLVVTPTAVDVILSCSTASETWTLTNNMTFATDVSYVWNSQREAGNVEAPLLTEMYTLIIKDSEAEISEFPEPGKLGADQGFTFGLYHPQPYTPWPEWSCVGCNSAASSHSDAHVVQFAFTMSAITFLTFTYFVAGWGIH